MKATTIALLISTLGLFQINLQAQTGPFDPEAWPPTRQANKIVHYVVTDGTLSPPSGSWRADELRILSGGDQVTTPITIGGHQALKVTGTYLNIADASFQDWQNFDSIDILMQVYGDGALLAPNGNPRNFNFLTGTLPELNAPVGGSLPVEVRNKKWNWVLFRIPNGTRASDGSRFVGSVPANAQGASQSGGVNGGTIRVQNVQSMIVRVVAFGEPGAFGEPEQINLFFPPEFCEPEPERNTVFVDISKNTSDHLTVLNNGDQTVRFEENVGPAGDKRKAVWATGLYMNFGITDNHLGKPCNDPKAVKICVDFYDDPLFTGINFGPEAYATDDQGGVTNFPEARRHTLEGTGQWVRRSWVIPAVNLRGVNTGAMTGGPRLVFDGPVMISRVDLGVFRTGNHPLAGQDPLPNCYEDPRICTEEYGSFAELDLSKGIQSGLAPGNSGGDQNMIQAEAGPAGDRRMAIRPAFNDGSANFRHNYLNFAITDNVLGPSSQPNARLAICVTYYDDPALAGATFRPEVYQSDQGGVTTLAFTSPQIAVPLEGTDRWREAYFEIPDMKFRGVNQGPQAAARFILTDKIFFSRVRYAVIRPCGPKAGVNALADCKPQIAPVLRVILTGNSIRLSWPNQAANFVLQESTSLIPANWQPVTDNPANEGNENVITRAVSGTKFYRLVQL